MWRCRGRSDARVSRQQGGGCGRYVENVVASWRPAAAPGAHCRWGGSAPRRRACPVSMSRACARSGSLLYMWCDTLRWTEDTHAHTSERPTVLCAVRAITCFSFLCGEWRTEPIIDQRHTHEPGNREPATAAPAPDETDRARTGHPHANPQRGVPRQAAAPIDRDASRPTRHAVGEGGMPPEVRRASARVEAGGGAHVVIC